MHKISFIPPLVFEILKGCVHYILGSLFFKSKKEHLGNLEKGFFISLQKFFSFSKKSNVRILDIHFHDVIKCLSIKQEINFTE